MMTEEEIHNICEKYHIKNYQINPDMSVDVNGDVYLSRKNLIMLPLSFNKVTGHFYAASNKLTSLESCPNYVGGYFSYYKNKLTSLEGCPNYVGGDFFCNHNALNKRQPSSNIDVNGIIYSDNLWKF